ncbi:hypothetical protein VTO42DRAFT_2606 [Malbranchea cinnamomea]
MPTTVSDMEQSTSIPNKNETVSVSANEKPVSPPSFEKKDKEEQVVPLSEALPQQLQPATSEAPPPKRPRKKVPWRGKQCIIALPLDDRRGQPDHGGPLLTPADVEKIFEKWKDDIQIAAQLTGGTQSCPQFPDPEESSKEWEQRQYRISFPNKAEWDAYVNFLKEEKLRALGVSLADEEPTPQQLPGQNISPPIPASSVNSNPMSTILNAFSPAFNQVAQTVSGIGSLTSPAAPFGILASSPFANQQLPFSNDQAVTPGYPFLPFQPTPPLQSFTPHNFYTSHQGGVSPLTAASLPNLTSLLGPVSPLTAEDTKRFPATSAPPIHSSHPLSNELQPSNYEAGEEKVNEADFGIEPASETILSNSVPQMAHPTPRGHRHNVSETLQKGVEQAEYELDNEHLSNHTLLGSRWAMTEEHRIAEQQEFHQPDPKTQTRHLQHLFGEQQRNRANADEGSEIDTNPSLTGGSPKPDMIFQDSRKSNHGTSHKATESAASFGGHKSRTSTSGLNVEAKAFDPSSQFSANGFSFFGQNAFQPTALMFNSHSPMFNATLSQNASNKAPSSGFNAAAKPFTASQNNEAGKFKFSSSSFNVEAPVFNPTGSFNFQFGGNSNAAENPGPKIFSNFDPSKPIPPTKRSKAIPIVRPDEKKGTGSDDTREGQGREKRTRHGAENDGREAVFVQPDHTLPSIPDTVTASMPAEAKEEADDNDSEKSTIPAESVKTLSSDTKAPSHDETKAWTPFEFKNSQEAAAFSASHPSSPPPAERGERQNGTPTQPEKPVPPIQKGGPSPDKELPPLPTQEDEAPQQKVFVFKPTAKPFEFKPVINVPPLPKPEPPPKEPTGLMASRYAVLSPPNSPKSKPLPDPPQQDSSDKVAERDSPDEQEIDAVMRQLNENDSDLGVERQKSLRVAEGDAAQFHASSPSIEEAQPETEREGRSMLALSPQRNVPFNPESPVHHLNNPELNHVSDWDDDFSPADDVELRHKSHFFDTHVNNLIGGVLDDRLGPLERTLNLIQRSIGLLVSGSPTPRRGQLVEHSDADDEDDEDPPYRPRSALEHRERRLERIKQAVIDALASQEASRTVTPPTVDLSGIQSALAEIKELAASKTQDVQADELKVVIAELKQLAVMNAAHDQRKIVNDAVTEIKQFVATKAEDDHMSELHDTVAQLKQLVIMKAEQDQRSQLHEAIAELKKLAAQKEEVDHGPELHDAVAQLKQLVIMKAEQDQRSDLSDAIAELRKLIESKQEPDQDSLKNIIAEVISIHPKFNEQRDASVLADDIEKYKLQIDGLQSMLRVADERADHEYNARRRTQDSLAESQRRLRIAEEDAARAREETAAIRQHFEEFKEQKLPEIERAEKDSAAVKKAQESLTLALSELSDKNIALESTLDEYRASRDRWVADLEESKAENKELRRTINLLKEQLESGLQARKGLRERFDRLQEDMIRLTENIARDQSSWRKREEELLIKYNTLEAKYEQEVRQRQKMELHIAELEEKEKEALKLKYILRQSQEENAKLEELLMNVRQESHDYQNKAARFEREFNEARESSRIEIQRVRNSMEADLEAANHQVNFVRAELEAQIAKLENHLEASRMKADTEAARHELLLDEAKESKAAALREAAEAKESALQEQRLLHERAMNDLRERHARALHNASEDRRRDESHYMELIALRDEKIEQLQDKITLLEDKLEVAKSAARAAAQAAQSAKNAVPAATSPSMTFAKGSNIPEKISPQALRESIMVLQDQLQQREGRIEELENELSLVDKDAPHKLKEKETEINWLRELLGVRIDDLQDIINILFQPSFDQQAARDAAIRLKANLQMQQQERERAMAGGTLQFPSLASLSSFAASPRALPLAAAAAWGNWRKGRENTASSSSISNGDSQQTPSKASSSSRGFLSGLMTPPNSNLRQALAQQAATSQQQRPYSENRSSTARQRGLSIRQMGKMPEPPRTPPLLRKSSYDHDAEATNYEDGVYIDDNESVIGGIVTRGPHATSADGPFGPAI